MPTKKLLYSTNPLAKKLIQEEFFKNRHYVWCSPQPDSRTATAHSYSRLTPPSSNPIEIYQNLKAAHDRGDKHNSDRLRITSNYTTSIPQWIIDGVITDDQADEIKLILDDTNLWVPLLYIVPIDGLGDRLKVVPAVKRAGTAIEYTVSDLGGDEFDVVVF